MVNSWLFLFFMEKEIDWSHKESTAIKADGMKTFSTTAPPSQLPQSIRPIRRNSLMPSCAGMHAPFLCFRVFNCVPALRPSVSQMMTDEPCTSPDAPHSFVPLLRHAGILTRDL